MAQVDFKVLNGIAIEEGAVAASIKVGTGTPESTITADVGSIYLDTTTGAGKLWKKVSGSGNTGWEEISSAASINALDWKESVRAASAAPGTLASDFEAGDIVGGVTLVAGNRILIKDQGTASENGIYTVNASGAPTRAADFVNPYVSSGAACTVEEGTYADQVWILATNNPIDIGVTSLNFVSIGVYTAGTGIDITNGVISATPYTPGDGIDISAFQVSVDLSATGGLEMVGLATSGEVAINVDATTNSTAINAANELAVRGYAKIVDTGTGSAQVADLVTVATTSSVMWLVSVKDGTTGVYSAVVEAATNGTALDYNISGVLKIGTIAKPTISVVMNGTTSMDLTITTTAGFTIQVTRIANLLA